jgi:hypothetical protein
MLDIVSHKNSKLKLKDEIKKPVVYEFHTDSLLVNQRTKDSIYTKGATEYLKLYDALWNYIFDDYKRKDNFVKVNFGTTAKPKHIYLTCAELMMHLIYWRLNVVYTERLDKKISITESDFYDLGKFNQDEIRKALIKSSEYILNLLFLDKEITESEADLVNELSFYISYIIDDIVELAEGYAVIACDTISIYDIIQLSKRSKEFKECIDTELDDTKPIKELEVELKLGGAKLLKSIIDDGKSTLVPYMKSKRLNPDQFSQMFYAVGPRVDVDKTVMPLIMRGNGLKGYQRPSDVYIDAITGRDAQLAKYINIRDSGYLSRKINLATLSTHIDYKVQDCGTLHYLEYYVENANYLRSINRKYMVLDNNKLYKIDSDRDKALIGKTIKLRSHIFCTLDKDRVCKTCFGGSERQLLGTRIGALPSIKLANPLSKRIMRAKHFTTSNSVDISSDIIDKYFTIEASKLYLRPEINAKALSIIVPREYVEELATGNLRIGDETIEVTPPLESLIINDNGEEHLVECEGLYLAFTDELLEEHRKFVIDFESDNAVIPLGKLESDTPLFTMVMVSEEVSKYLAQIKRLINSSIVKSYKSVSDLLHDMIKVLINSGLLETNIIHVETLLYQLIRNKNKIYERPDFTQKDVEYGLIPLANAIMKKDIYTALAFEKFKMEMKDLDSFIKTSSGLFDPIFKTEQPKYLKKVDPAIIASVL